MSASTIPSTSSASSSNHVLSDKVNRALHVRTDTPAMRAALDALANLPSEESLNNDVVAGVGGGGGMNNNSSSSSGSSNAGGGGGGGGTIDARSVRMAIERDALRRALQFQEELQRLANDATMLRERVDAVAKVAQMVGSRVETPVIVSTSVGNNHHHQSGMGMGGGGGFMWGGNNNNNNLEGGMGGVHDTDSLFRNNPHSASNEFNTISPESAWEEERALASRLHYAHKSLIEASHRQVAVDAFLDKFDLGEGEARLLDHYNFEGFIEGGGGQFMGGDDGQSSSPWSHPNAALHVIGHPEPSAVEDATSFLDALERLVIIRQELTKTFGGGTDSSRGTKNDMDDDDDYNSNTNPDEDYDDDNHRLSTGKQLGTHSALRMMEQLASRQERAHERLYNFLQFFLGIGTAAAALQQQSHVPTSSSQQQMQQQQGRRTSEMAFYTSLGRFHDGDEMDEAYSHPILRRCLHVLRHSPSHQSHALELIASSRRTEVTRRFLLALTSGYDGAAPMEMRAHDPVAYVGDMLAFAFRAFRVEGELVRSLMSWRDGDEEDSDGEGEGGMVGKKDGIDKSGNAMRKQQEEKQLEGEDEERGDVPMDSTEMLAQSMGGLARPLRSRISQVVKSLASQGNTNEQGYGNRNSVTGHSSMLDGGHDADEEESSSSLNRLVAVFSVCGLLKFYGSAVRKALAKLQSSEEGDDSYYYEDVKNPFLVTCDECLAEAADSYVASLCAYGAMLSTHSGPMETESQLAQRVIVRISEERVASPGFAEDSMGETGGEEKEDLVAKQLSLSFLVGTMIDAAMPYLRTLDDGASLKAALTTATKCGLESSESTKWSKQVEEKERILVSTLVDTETEKVLEVCGLGGIRTALRHMNGVYVEGMTMASHPGLSQPEVETAMKQFYSSLYSPPIPSFEEAIKDPDLRKRARSMTAQRVVEVYRDLHGAITSDKGGYDDVAFLGHDPNQVKTLLSI